MNCPQPYDHYRAGSSDPIPAGVYRVVGTGEEIALLRVGDSEGLRVRTGEVVTVSRDTVGQFEDAPNPDAGFSVTDILSPVRTWATAIRHWLPF